MSQAGVNSLSSSGGGAVVETLTGNSGGAVGPDASFNINVIGNNTSGINVVGMPASSTLAIVGIQSTTTQQGTITLATNAEAIAGTDTAKAITADDLKAKLGSQTAHSLALFQGTSSALTPLGAATNGQIPIGSTGADPVLGNLTSTGGTIAITNGAGTINLDLTGAGIAIDSLIPDTGSTVIPTGAGAVTFNANSQSGSSVFFSGSGSTMSFNVTDANYNTIVTGKL